MAASRVCAVATSQPDICSNPSMSICSGVETIPKSSFIYTAATASRWPNAMANAASPKHNPQSLVRIRDCLAILRPATGRNGGIYYNPTGEWLVPHLTPSAGKPKGDVNPLLLKCAGGPSLAWFIPVSYGSGFRRDAEGVRYRQYSQPVYSALALRHLRVRVG